MIQDIAPHTYHNEYKPSAPDKDCFILAYEKGSILLPRQERDADITFPRFRELEEKIADLYSNFIYLFSIDDQYLAAAKSTDLFSNLCFSASTKKNPGGCIKIKINHKNPPLC